VGFQILGALPAISSNSVAELGAILAIVALARMTLRPRATLFYLPLFGFSFVTMVLAQGRSAFLAFLLAAVVVLAANRRPVVLVCYIGLLSMLPLSGLWGTISAFFERGQTADTLASLDGRTIYWDASLQAIRQRPLGGLGAFGGGRYITQNAFGSDQVVTTVHNAYVETLAGTGIVGLTLLVLGVVSIWYYLFRLRSFATRYPTGRLLWVESLGVISILTVRSMFSVGIIWTPILTFGLLLIFIAVVRHQEISARKRSTAARPPQAIQQAGEILTIRTSHFSRGPQGGNSP